METKQSPKTPKFIDAFGDVEMDVEGTMATDWLKLQCSGVQCACATHPCGMTGGPLWMQLGRREARPD